MYYYAIFQFRSHQIGVRVFAYGGRDEAISLARGELVDPNCPLVSCKPCEFG